MIFEFNYCNHFKVFKTFMFFSENLFDLRFTLNLIFIKSINLFKQFILFMQDLNHFKSLILREILNFKLNNSFSFLFNVIIKRLILFKLLNKLKISINIVIIDIVIFYKLNF